MSNPSIQSRIRQHPRFAELVGRRTRFAIVLSALVLIPYYSFMMIVAFKPELLRQSLGEGVTATLGWPVGAALIIGSWLLTGLYVRRANGEFDQINEQILKETWK
jgi:uncharacterized membrane protein (DUF485 family)